MTVSMSIKIKNILSYISPILHFILPSKKRTATCDYLAIVAIIKNEGPYIIEWIEYHILLGVSRFYLYDAATDNTKEILKPYIDSGVVIYHEALKRGIQIQKYNEALSRYRNKARWMAFIDADEFISVEDPYQTIPDLLRNFEKNSGVGINWIVYDSNGHIDKPDGLVIKNYTRVHKDNNFCDNLYIKSIVDPKNILFTTSAHWFVCNPFRKVRWVVDENHKPIVGAKTKENSVNLVRISHYHSKSYEEYVMKAKRGVSISANSFVPHEVNYNFPDAKQDYTMLKYVDRLDKKLAEIHN